MRLRHPFLAAALLAVSFSDPRAPYAEDPPGTYAGKSAEWWVGELRGKGTQRAASEALKMIGPAAFPALAKVLRHHDPVLREHAAGLLLAIPGDLASVADDVLAGLAHEQTVQARYSLLRLVSRLGPEAPRASPHVLATLQGSEAESTLRPAAAEALRALRRPTPEYTEFLWQCLRTMPPGSRGTVLSDISHWDQDTSALVPELTTILRRATSETGGPAEARPEFSPAAAALAKAGRGAPGTLAVLLGAWSAAKNAYEQRAVAIALGSLTPPAEDDLAPLLAALPKVPVPLRAYFSHLLGTLGPRAGDALPWLAQELGRGEQEGVAAAVRALGRIGPAAASALPAMLDAHAAFPGHDYSVWGAITALAPEAPVPFLAAFESARDRAPYLQTFEFLANKFIERSHAEAVAAAVWRVYRSHQQLAQTPAGRVLVLLFPHAPNTLDLVLDAASAPAETGARAAADLAAMSAAARARLPERARHPDAAKRLGALRVLGSPWLKDRTLEESLLVVERLDDESAPVRFFAARKAIDRVYSPGGLDPTNLTPHATRRGLEVVLEYLQTPEGRIEEWPILALSFAEPGLEEAVPVLLGAFLEEPEGVRAARIGSHVIGQAKKHPAALRAALTPVLASASPLLRARAAWVWAWSEGESEPVDARVGELLASEDAVVRRWAVRVAAAIDRGRGTARAPLLEHLRDSDAGVREEAFRMLIFGKVVDAEVLAALRALLLDPKVSGRKELPHALMMGDAQVVPLLVAGLDDAEIRQACLSALSGMGPNAVAALPRLEQLRKEVPPTDADLLRLIGIVIDSIRR